MQKTGPDNDKEVAELTNFCVDNPLLEQLNSILAGFNMFEAAGMVRDEVKHSRFLSFLLDPRESHGLGDAFLTKMLQLAVQGSELADLPVNALDLELWDLSDTEIFAEWNNIDILVLNHNHKFAVVIENKIGASEHSDQLNRYFKLLNQTYPGWKVLPLFLSPEGTEPTDSRFVAVTYESVATVVDHFCLSRASSLGGPVLIVLQHYSQLLRRHVLSDSQVKELCQEIYRKHRKALDLIFEYRRDHMTVIREHLSVLIKEEPELERKWENSSLVAFMPKSWDVWAPRDSVTSWTTDGQMLMFWFRIRDNGVSLVLEIGPGNRIVAQKLLDAANGHRPLFNPQSRKVGQKWNRIVRLPLVSAAALQSGDLTRMLSEFEPAWNQFLRSDVAKMGEILRLALETGA